MLALLELDQYFVDEFSIQTNFAFKGDDKYEIDWNVDFEIGRSTDGKPNFEVKLLVDANQNDDYFQKGPYRIHLVITGYFHFPEEADEDQISKLIAPNGLAILYGIARNTVSQTTGISRFGRFLLPSINMMKVIQDKAMREESAEKDK